MLIKKYTRLKDLRKDFAYTQLQVARKIGVSQRCYSNLERGERNMKAEYLERLAQLYNVSVDYLIEEFEWVEVPSRAKSKQAKES